jgi:ankyrin repeat protein
MPKAERDGTALHYEAQSGNTEAVQLLIDEGAHFLPDRDGWTPLHTAASAGEADTMKVFFNSARHSWNECRWL